MSVPLEGAGVAHDRSPRPEEPAPANQGGGDPRPPWRRVQVIINPRAGKDLPILRSLHTALGPHLSWDVSILHRRGDAPRLVAEALAGGAEVVAVYGGGGTVAEVAGALAGGSVPLAILPGGTGNGIARALRIPLDLHDAAALLAGPCTVRRLDLGRVNGRTFVQEADLGFIAAMNRATSRRAKDRLGPLAYVLSSVRVRRQLRLPMRLQLQIDGREIEAEAVMVRILNIGATFFRQRALVPGSLPDDGLLDLVVVPPESAASLVQLARGLALGYPEPVLRWRIRSALIRTDPPLPIDLDGDLAESTPARVEVLPASLQVVLPALPGGVGRP